MFTISDKTDFTVDCIHAIIESMSKEIFFVFHNILFKLIRFELIDTNSDW